MSYFPVKALSVLVLVGLVAAVFPHSAVAADSAVVLVYHRFGEDAYPDSSIRLDQFGMHLDELRDGGFHVLPLAEVVSGLRNGTPLPDKAVAITIDGARRSVMDEAVPRLVRYGFPFTVFVASDAVDFSPDVTMGWKEIAELPKKGGTIGLYPSSLAAMGLLSPDEAASRINRSAARIAEMTGSMPTLLAWPAGEASAAIKERVEQLGYKVAFGMQSGSVAAGMDMLMLPRFSMTETYGDIERFRIATRALPLPVSDMVPEDMVLRENPPNIGFTVEGGENLSRLSCFISGRGKAHVEVLGDTRVEVRLDAPLEDRRTRLNCTLPAGQDEGGVPRWRWLGAQYVLPESLAP